MSIEQWQRLQVLRIDTCIFSGKLTLDEYLPWYKPVTNSPKCDRTSTLN
ncbi:hypothetical protein LC653_40530 [Nostoc sp. CHAB 5784]|nr:hypothetical protein [Nostoc mirabile]MCC5669929.1 hypothetical protein [Nostoc mirabile CHAB5784]